MLVPKDSELSCGNKQPGVSSQHGIRKFPPYNKHNYMCVGVCMWGGVCVIMSVHVCVCMHVCLCFCTCVLDSTQE